MFKFIIHENIARFRRRLAEEPCADERETLRRLLGEEEAKLAALCSKDRPRAPDTDGRA